MSKTVLIAGASGLVGSHLLNELLLNPVFTKVIILNRRMLFLNHPKLEQILFDYNKEASYQNLPPADSVFCCLGTTIKKAGSQEAFKKVDYTYPLNLAKYYENSASKFHVITAMGANSNSLLFYNKVKGTLEDALKKCNFGQLFIYRPSLLLGNRQENRLGEKLGATFMNATDFFMLGPLKKYKAIKAVDVAKAMVQADLKIQEPVKIFLSDEIQALADSYSV